MIYIILINALLTLVLAIGYIKMHNRQVMNEENYKLLDSWSLEIIKNQVDKNEEVTRWRYEKVVADIVRANLENDVKERIKRSSKEVVNNTINHALQERLTELSQEMAKKYTYENFEKELKDKMLEKLGNELSSNLLNHYNGY